MNKLGQQNNGNKKSCILELIVKGNLNIEQDQCYTINVKLKVVYSMPCINISVICKNTLKLLVSVADSISVKIWPNLSDEIGLCYNL